MIINENELSEYKEKQTKLIDGYFLQKGSETVGSIKEKMYKIMIDRVGVYRNKEDLAKAVKELAELKTQVNKIQLSSKSKEFNVEMLSVFDVKKMIELAEAIAGGALLREESRGSHSRTDFPIRNDEKFLHHTLFNIINDKPEFSKKEVDISIWEPQERRY